MSLPLIPTLIILAGCIAVLAVGQLRERRRYRPGRLGLIPWGPLQFIAILGSIMMLAHLISLATGEPLVGRFAR